MTLALSPALGNIVMSHLEKGERVKVHTSALACVAAGLLASSAGALTFTPSWVEIANNYPWDLVPDYASAVLADDLTLANTPARTFDLVVTTSPDIKWASCDLQVSLASTDSFYVKTGSDMRHPAKSTWAASPAAEFSTFLCVPSFEYISQGINPHGGCLLGKAQYPLESGTGPAILELNKIDAAWGHLYPQSGTFTIARLTLLDSFDGGFEFTGRIGSANNIAGPTNIYANYAPPAVQFVPEPGALAIVLLAGMILARRRKA